MPNPFGLEREAEHNIINGGDQYKFTFANGRGASVVRHMDSYGHERGLWELAVLDAAGRLDYSTPITDDVKGWLDEEAVSNILGEIAALPMGDAA